MERIKILIVMFLFALTLAAGQVNAADPANIYHGKTVRIIVGLAAGGGYDLYARTLARHLGKHIPGNPAVVVENMTGAGSIIAANHLYKIAKPDGLTIGHYLGGIALQQLLGKSGIEFDALKFKYIGVPAQYNFIIGMHKSTGITDVHSWIASKQMVKFGWCRSRGGQRRYSKNISGDDQSSRPSGFRLQGNRRHAVGV